MSSRLLLLALLVSPLARAGGDDEEERAIKASPAIEFADALVAPATIAATVGGAQDIRHLRDRVRDGEVPLPQAFTPEGLFSEHDLPLPAGRCAELLCPVAAATPATLTVQPEVRWLAQLGFHTGLDAASFRRAPLNVVAVVDKSGSMAGAPLELVQDALHHLVDQLGAGDQLSVVLYGDTVHTFIAPTSAGARAALHRDIDRIASAGSTNLEAGLQHGFALAAETAARFDGVTRVMLFTDERPNVGRTDAQGFMAMARAASEAGIGLTTVGVGAHFGAELAQAVSSVRGGNLFFFADEAEMTRTFRDELDTMVTELAYDMDLVLRPAPGLTIAGVYGIPGEAVTWDAQGGLSLHVATLFASKEEGGIYVAFAPEGAGARPPAATGRVGTVSLAYTLRGGRRVAAEADFLVTPAGAAPVGLTRGALLVEEVTVLKQATALHHQQNDQEGAWRLVAGLSARLGADPDPALDPERELVAALEQTLARLSGHRGEPSTARRDPVTGLPRR